MYINSIVVYDTWHMITDTLKDICITNALLLTLQVIHNKSTWKTIYMIHDGHGTKTLWHDMVKKNIVVTYMYVNHE